MTKSEQVLAALESQDIEMVEVYLEEAIAQDSPDLLLELGEYMLGLGLTDYAKSLFEAVQSDFPLESALNIAIILYDEGQIEEAFSYLEEIPDTSPIYLRALLTKADFYQAEGLSDVAREKLIEARRLSDDPIIVFGLAELNMELENYRDAIEDYATLDHEVIYEATGISTYQRIGLAYAYLGKFEAAVEFLEKSLELAYNDKTLHEIALLCLEREEYDRATIYFKQLDTLNPDYEGYEIAYALALEGNHQLERALEITQKGIEKNPFDGPLLLEASKLAYETHQKDLSERYLKEAMTVSEYLDEAVLRLAKIYLKDERYEELVELESEHLDNLVAKWYIAQAYRFLEDYKEAGIRYAALESELAHYPDFLKDYGEFLLESGNRSDAKRVLSVYLEEVPDDGDLLDRLESIEG